MDLRSGLHMEDVIEEDDLADGIPPYYRPPPDSVEMRYMMERRRALDGAVPRRVVRDRRPIALPSDGPFRDLQKGSGGREVSTTMAFTSRLRELLRDHSFGRRVVPIVPDEARTFGMDSLFREFKIYAPRGQLYEPVDHDLLLSYSESSDGQILGRGHHRVWLAGQLARRRDVLREPRRAHGAVLQLLPRCSGSSAWATRSGQPRTLGPGAFSSEPRRDAPRCPARGCSIRTATATVLASTVPACEAYDPAFAYELGAIVNDGLRRMCPPAAADGEDVFFYITIYNENYEQPPRPDHVTDSDITSGLYRWDDGPGNRTRTATIMFSGSAVGAAREAQALLAEHHDVSAELWSATSYQRLRREALDVERRNRLHPGDEPAVPVVTRKLNDSDGPIVAVTDYMTLVPDQVSRFTPRPLHVLGTDGFGRSDTRQALRRFFEVDGAHIVIAVLSALMSASDATPDEVAFAMQRYGIEAEPRRSRPPRHRRAASLGLMRATTAGTLAVTGNVDADRLLNADPLALLLGMQLDQQIPLSWAFMGPHRLAERLGNSLDAHDISELDPEAFASLVSQKPALHRFPTSMAKRIQALCRHLVDNYDGDAGAVWAEAATGEELFRRLRALPGYGDEKARILMAVLAKRLRHEAGGLAGPGRTVLRRAASVGGGHRRP